MRANQIGFLLCRLAAVAMFLWYLPETLGHLIGALGGDIPGTRSFDLRMFVVDVFVMFTASVVWVAAHRIGRLFVDDDQAVALSIDGAQFAAIGFALVGVGAIVAVAGSVNRQIIEQLSANWHDKAFFVLLLLGGRGNAPATALLGLLLLLFAPRLGIWLENATFRATEVGDEPR